MPSFFFFPLVPLTAQGLRGGLQGLKQEGWWGRQQRAQLAGGIEMAARPRLGAWSVAQPPPRREHRTGREGGS